MVRRTKNRVVKELGVSLTNETEVLSRSIENIGKKKRIFNLESFINIEKEMLRTPDNSKKNPANTTGIDKEKEKEEDSQDAVSLLTSQQDPIPSIPTSTSSSIATYSTADTPK